MIQKKSRFVLLSASALTVAALIPILFFVDSIGPQQEMTTTSQSELDSNGSSRDVAELEQDIRRDEAAITITGYVNQGPEARAGIAPSPFGENKLLQFPPDSAHELFVQAANDHQWSESQLRENYNVWAQSCRTAVGLADAPNAEEVESMFSPAMRRVFAKLNEFCGTLDADAELMSLDHFASRLEKTSDESSEEDALVGALSDQIDSFSSSELARNSVADELRSSIQSFDEARTIALILTIATHRLLEHSDFHSGEFWHTALRISPDIAISLICQQFGGCSGVDHPVVLRYCVSKYQTEGLICSSPSSIEDAIYQTSAPVVYDWYLRFSGAIRSELASRP